MRNGDSTRNDGQEAAERTVTVPNRLGLHARPAAEFVKLSARYESKISVDKDGLTVNGKSIMGVMMLAAEYGSVLRILAEGPDAEEAASALSDLVASGFGEHESDYADPGEEEAATA